ncbi:nickel ABC transporter substrate-binding protein [Treponema pedis]|uniref:Nickel ABC transporter periplasmicnickel-binding protein n=2 Tax=Treponema pedis TaxID=409322 RepID=S6A963_9SPIR|nr:nickel ABC transporter substrate-binding protein [Treponema pedis]AGT45024.1 nickel ABC transporter periplasmicnickel-binding protein [Treponema pedis str. T A4]
MVKKVLALFLALIPLSLFAEKGTLNFAVSKNVGVLNPHLYSPNEMFAQDMVYESLVEFSDDGKILPWLAKSWSIGKDGTVYRFVLRDDVVFSNGEKFDAKAAKANFDALLENRSRHAWLELANILENCKIVGKYEIELTIKNAYEPTLRELSLIRPFRFIAPSAMMNGSTKDGIKAPIGTGPWKLVDTKQGISDTFEVNEKYWGKKPSIKKVVAKIIPEPNTKVIALKTGEVDLIYGGGQIPLDSFNELKKEFNSAVSKPLLTLVVALNSTRFPTNDKTVRKALNMAVAKDLMVEKIFFNTSKRADFLFDKTLENTDISAQAYEFDIKKANDMLEKAGYKMGKDKIRYKDGKKLEITLIYIGNNAVYKSIGEVLRANFAKIGVALELKADESTIFYKKQKTGDFGAIFNETWGAPYDPQAFLASMRLPSHADYQAQLGLSDKKQIDEKIGRMLVSLDPKERRELTHELLTAFHEEAVYIPLLYETNKAVWNKRLDGVNMHIIKNRVPFAEMSLR